MMVEVGDIINIDGDLVGTVISISPDLDVVMVSICIKLNDGFYSGIEVGNRIHAPFGMDTFTKDDVVGIKPFGGVIRHKL
jgi:hypothetical protein